MKRKPNLFDKTLIYLKWLKGEAGYGLRGSCDFCHSTKLDRLASNTKKNPNGTITYTATYKCMKCGSFAEATEIWRKPKDTSDMLLS